MRPAFALLSAALGCLLTGCFSRQQRVPGPIPLPAGEESVSVARGDGAESLVLRHSDPVWIVQPGAQAGYPLSYYRKRERVRSATRVIVGSGGRAELNWPGDATAIVLYEVSQVVLGDPERDEPLVRFDEITRALLRLTPEDRIILPGGAELRGSASDESGPFLVRRLDREILRINNQSDEGGRVLLRGTVLELAPGDSIDLPILELSRDTLSSGSGLSQLVAEGFNIDVQGRVEPVTAGGVVRLRAMEASEVTASGVRLRLQAGEEAVLGSLTSGTRPIEDVPRQP